MMYICQDCGCEFNDEEIITERSVISEAWGVPYYQEDGLCPNCKSSSIEEAKKCVACGDFRSSDDMVYNVCTDCVEKYAKNFDFCEKVCGDEKATIRISSLLASLIDESDIEAILREYIKNRMEETDCRKFVGADEEWFAERIAEEVKKNENGKK